MNTMTPPTQPEHEPEPVPGLPAQIQAPPPRKHHRVRWALLSVAALLIALVAIGVATAHPAKVTPAASPPPAATSQPAATPASIPPATPAPADLTGPIGTTYVDTATSSTTGAQFSYDVTAVKVLDPAAAGNEFLTPPAGQHLVGVEFTITGVSGYAKDDSDLDASVIGSDGQAYTATFDSLAAGTNFNGGDFGATPGSSETGWVAFEVPDGVTVAQVQWGSTFGSAQPAVWTNN